MNVRDKVRHRQMPEFVGFVIAIYPACKVNPKEKQDKPTLYDVKWVEAPSHAMNRDGSIAGIPMKEYEHTRQWDRTGRGGYRFSELEFIEEKSHV